MSRNVLVIDDDEIMLQVIADLLTDKGYRVTTQASPIGATQTVIKENIDVVVVDWRMPVMQGDRLVSLLRTWEKARDLPVILISGTSRVDLERVAMGLSGVSIVTNDTLDRELPRAVRRALISDTNWPEPRQRENQRSSVNNMEGFESFYDRLGNRIEEAIQLWAAIGKGGSTGYRELDYLIDTIHGQAQLLGLADMADLLSEIHAVTYKVSDGKTPTQKAYDSVDRALKFAGEMPALHKEGRTRDVAPVLRRLRDAKAVLGA